MTGQLKWKRILNDDTLGGALCVALGLFGLYLARDLPLGTAMRMGPGYVPTLLCGMLAALGAALAVGGVLARASWSGPTWSLRPFLLIVGATLTFAILVIPAGIVVAAFLGVVVSRALDLPREAPKIVATAAAISAVASAVFVAGLELPIKLFPWS